MNNNLAEYKHAAREVCVCCGRRGWELRTMELSSLFALVWAKGKGGGRNVARESVSDVATPRMLFMLFSFHVGRASSPIVLQFVFCVFAEDKSAGETTNSRGATTRPPNPHPLVNDN